MIKRVIFDIDNTLIPWKDEYYDGIGKGVFEKLCMDYTSKDVQDIINGINSYEQKEQYFSKEKFSNVLKQSSKLQLPDNFLETLLDYFSTCLPASIPNEVTETLAYLKEKYELVTLTNWFEKEQEERLEKVGLMQYFQKIYACEKFKIKPYKESYITAAGSHKMEECVMIGDSIKNDVQGAIECNMNAIYYNPAGKQTNYKNIQSFLELKKIL